MSDSMIVSLTTISIPVVMVVMVVITLLRLPTSERKQQEAQERRDAEWLAQVDEWNRPNQHTDDGTL